jgi:dihydrofolate synthase/folylpolyglutamate synthase
MTYAEAIQFLYGLQVFGANLGLERMQRLAELAGHPEKKLRFIHVAGTNGKGSTCAMLESIYRAAGLRVGLFTSPHLVSFRERMQVNRQLISEHDLVQLVAETQLLLKKFPAGNHPTMFEAVTLMALKYFAEQKCDLVIWETGLGGRLDATNIVTPLASVITNIALDHTQWLGDTLPNIAAEKAGIIKSGVPVITAENKPESLSVIEKTARVMNAPLTQIRNSKSEIQDVKLPLPGEHQKINAVLALATVEVLQSQIPVTPGQIRAGFASVNWPGRLQLIQRGGQKILLDGAHNAAGAETLRAALDKDFAGLRPAFILGVLADKDWSDICRILAPLAAKIFTVPVASPRTMSPVDLADKFHALNPQTTVSAQTSLAAALAACDQEPFVVITGSLYLIGEALERLDPSAAATGERALNDWQPAKPS